MVGGDGSNGGWRKSSYSGSGNCVEVRVTGDAVVQVRDSKAPADAPVLTFTATEWAAFLAGVKAGEFDL